MCWWFLTACEMMQEELSDMLFIYLHRLAWLFIDIKVQQPSQWSLFLREIKFQTYIDETHQQTLDSVDLDTDKQPTRIPDLIVDDQNHCLWKNISPNDRDIEHKLLIYKEYLLISECWESNICLYVYICHAALYLKRKQSDCHNPKINNIIRNF